MKVGYIGHGMTGSAMAEQLTGPGMEATVYDVFPAAMSPFEGKARLASSPADLGRSADLVGICVMNDEQVRSVLTGPNGLLETLAKGSIVAIHSTIRSSSVKALAETASAKGIHVIDAAVSGGPMAARAKTLVCMVGGDAALLERAKPLLTAYCGNIIHAGGIGMGMALKMSNNLVTYIELMSAIEGYRLAQALGLDPGMLTSVMTDNGNLTTAMKLYVQYRQTGPAQIGAEAFRKSQVGLADLGEKDLELALEMAAQTGIKLPITDSVRRQMRDIILEGL